MHFSSQLIKLWLKSGMFPNAKDDEINSIVRKLNEHDLSKEHSRHFDKNYCKSIGLIIEDLESDGDFQDKVLSVHHSFMISFGASSAVKIIQNQEHSWIVNSTKK